MAIRSAGFELKVESIQTIIEDGPRIATALR
jgi:hypothetical protein